MTRRPNDYTHEHPVFLNVEGFEVKEGCTRIVSKEVLVAFTCNLFLNHLQAVVYEILFCFVNLLRFILIK